MPPPLARGLRPSPLVSSLPGHQHDGAASSWTAAQLAAARWTAARSRRQCATLAPRELRPPSVASRLIAVQTAARQGGYVLAPPLDSRRPSVASCLRRRLCSGAASSCALDSGAARQLCAGGYVLAPPLDSRQPSVASCLRRRLYSSAARQLRAGAASQLGASARGVRPSPLVCVAPCTGWTAARLPGQLCARAAFDSRPPSTASRLIATRAAVWRGGCARRGEGAVC